MDFSFLLLLSLLPPQLKCLLYTHVIIQIGNTVQDIPQYTIPSQNQALIREWIKKNIQNFPHFTQFQKKSWIRLTVWGIKVINKVIKTSHFFFLMIFALALVFMSRAETSLSLSHFFLVYPPFTDRCRLEQPSFLEQIQDNLVRMLYYLLEDHHGEEFMVAFSRIISMLTGLRSLTENYFRQFKTICKDDLIKQEMPELLGFLFDEWSGTFVFLWTKYICGVWYY